MNVIDNTSKVNKLGECVTGDIVRLVDRDGTYLIMEPLYADPDVMDTSGSRQHLVDLTTGFHTWVNNEMTVTLLNGELTVTDRRWPGACRPYADKAKSRMVYLCADVQYDHNDKPSLVRGLIETIRAVRALTGKGLKDAKDFVDEYVRNYDRNVRDEPLCSEADLDRLVKNDPTWISRGPDFFTVR